MGRVLAGHEPADVLNFFEDICGIPHPSFHEKEISDYIVKFAQDRNLTYFQDDIYNVIIIKEATPDMADSEPIILQGHIDMVAEKEPDCDKDMKKDPLDLEIVHGCITAKGTTLGGDNGIAVAMMLAVLDDDTLSHPRLECIFTTNEEVTMGGVERIDVSSIEGTRLLNLDSEEEGIITCGCAGGVKCAVTVAMDEHEVPLSKLSASVFEVKLSGLAGGHSGNDINKGRANSNLVLAGLLKEIYGKARFGLISFNGGNLVNAIPRYASAVVVGTAAEKAMITEAVEELTEKWHAAEPEMEFTITDVELPGDTPVCIKPEKLFDIILEIPSGVIEMSPDIEGLVQTSNNVGVVAFSSYENNAAAAVQKGRAAFKMQGRSSVGSSIDKLIEEVEAIGDKYEGHFLQDSRYPAWEFNPESELRESWAVLYEEMFGKKAVLDVVHAGLECGLFAEKIRGLDAISVGPDIFDVHSPSERMPIESVERTYRLLKEFIRRG